MTGACTRPRRTRITAGARWMTSRQSRSMAWSRSVRSVRRARWRAGLTQRHLGKLCGLPVGHLEARNGKLANLRWWRFAALVGSRRSVGSRVIDRRAAGGDADAFGPRIGDAGGCIADGRVSSARTWNRGSRSEAAQQLTAGSADVKPPLRPASPADARIVERRLGLPCAMRSPARPTANVGSRRPQARARLPTVSSSISSEPAPASVPPRLRDRCSSPRWDGRPRRSP